MSKTKKLLALFLAILMVVTMLPISAVAVESQKPAGEQYETDGWIAIGTAAEFLAMGTTGNYYLTDDIDFSTLPEDHANYGKIVDGVYTDAYLVKTFDGNLDGRGKTLSGFAISTSGTGGVFNEAATSAMVTIKNLNVGSNDQKIQATLNGTDTKLGFLVGSVGNNNRVNIDNVHVYGELKVNIGAATKENRIGGFVGYCKEVSIYNSSFGGSITGYNACTSGYICIGGLIGELENYGNRGRVAIIKNSKVDATLSATKNEAGEYTEKEYVGGIVGLSEVTTYVDGCTVSGKYTGHSVGKIIGSASKVNVNSLNVFTDNTVDATCVETNNDAYGSIMVEGPRFYIDGCTGITNTSTKNAEDYVEGDSGYVYLIDKAEEITAIGETLPANGFYRLADNISMNATFDTAVVDCAFSGVFDGAGYSITGITMKPNDDYNYMGLFKTLSGEAGSDSIVLDVTLGAPDKYIAYEGHAQFAGILAGVAGMSNTVGDPRAIIDGVEVYANMYITTSDNQLQNGGLVGLIYGAYLFNCNTYGSISSPSDATFGHRVQIGGMVGMVENIEGTYYNCKNFVDVDVKGTATNNTPESVRDWMHVGGLIGLSNPADELFYNCYNFGTVSNEGVSKYGNVTAGGIIGCDYRASTSVNCANFGNVYSNKGKSTNKNVYAGGWSGEVCSTAGAIKLYGFEQYGEINGTACAGTAFAPINCKTELAVTMKEGASVRLSAETGLRFEATVSTAAIDRIEEILGENTTVSRGILIAPQTFVANAGGSTHKALDIYADPESKNGFTEGQKAYIEIISDAWFKGNEGDIAGSIIGLPTNNYDTEFVGVGFLTVSVGGTELVKLYAANAQTKDICYVAKKALDDTTSTSGEIKNGYTYDKAIEVGETYYVDGSADVFEEGDTPVYSCYTKTQRDTLNKIINDAK